MIIVQSVVGNAHDEPWKAKLDGAAVDVLGLDQWQAQKNRFRLKTEAGVEVAVALERNTHLRDGDILVWDEATRAAIVARIDLQDVLVIKLDGLVSLPAEGLARTCFELGHALGNQHWPAVVKGTTVYVPLTVDRKVMASVMRTHDFRGITSEFAPGREVIPYLAPHEARRLFGGSDSTPHSHLDQLPVETAESPGTPHTHVDAQGHSYTHVHDTPDSPGHSH